jgi:hypothetical protein
LTFSLSNFGDQFVALAQKLRSFGNANDARRSPVLAQRSVEFCDFDARQAAPCVMRNDWFSRADEREHLFKKVKTP